MSDSAPDARGANLSKLASRFVEKGLPTRVMFYCSPLMRCVEEQYKAVFYCVRDLELVHPDKSTRIDCVFSNTLPERTVLQQWDTDCSTLYVLAMNVRELKRLLALSKQKLPLYYVWYQTEQFSNTRFFRDSIWMRGLSNAVWIWEYSEANAEYLKTRVGHATITLVRHAFCASTMLHSPLVLPPTQSKLETTATIVEKEENEQNKETAASVNSASEEIVASDEQANNERLPRRQRFLRSHRSFAALQRSQTTPKASNGVDEKNKDTNDFCDVLLLGVVAGDARVRCVRLLRDKYKLKVDVPPRGRYWYEADREQQIRRAKVCINVHYFRTPSVLETARLTLLLANGSAVVSEHSTAGDGIMDRRFEQSGAVLFVDQDDFDGLGQLCRQLIDDDAKRLEQRHKAVSFSKRSEQSVQAQAKEMLDLFRALYSSVTCK